MNFISVLQALGYFYKLGSIASLTPPLVIVITEEWANIIVFPFRRDQDLLANCVKLEGIPLHTGNTLNRDLLSFILLFTCPSVSALMTPLDFPTYGGIPVSKESLLCQIVKANEMTDSLTIELKELRKELKKKNQKAQKAQRPKRPRTPAEQPRKGPTLTSLEADRSLATSNSLACCPVHPPALQMIS